MDHVVPALLQVPLDGTHVKVGVLHQLQGGCNEAQLAQEEEGWLVLSDLGEGKTMARSPSILSSGRYTLPRSVLNLAPM